MSRAADVVTVLGHDVVARIGHRRPEVLLHARIGRISPNGEILRALLLLVPRDDLRDRQRPRRRHVAAIREHLGGAFVEIEHHRSAGQRHLHTNRPGDVVARVIARGDRGCPRRRSCTTGVPPIDNVAATCSGSGRRVSPVHEIRRERALVEEHAEPIRVPSRLCRRSKGAAWWRLDRGARCPTSAAPQSARAPAGLLPDRSACQARTDTSVPRSSSSEIDQPWRVRRSTPPGSCNRQRRAGIDTRQQSAEPCRRRASDTTSKSM